MLTVKNRRKWGSVLFTSVIFPEKLSRKLLIVVASKTVMVCLVISQKLFYNHSGPVCVVVSYKYQQSTNKNDLELFLFFKLNFMLCCGQIILLKVERTDKINSCSVWRALLGDEGGWSETWPECTRCAESEVVPLSPCITGAMPSCYRETLLSCSDTL